MHSRRKFLIQGGMATTAIIALKPFTAIARLASPFTGLHSSSAKLTFLHTGKINSLSTQQEILNIKNRLSNVILLHAGNKEPGAHSFVYDASVAGTGHPSDITDDYRVIKKAAVNIGIITAKPGEHNIIQKIETLSAHLKKEKNCQVVVCLSQLGYKNNSIPDDQMLAKSTTHLDLIIGGHLQNFAAHPVIVLNKVHGEVVIHNASGNEASLGIISFNFDGQGQKKSIGFTA